MDNKKPNYALALTVLLTAFAFLFYSSLPAILMRIDKGVSSGKITDINDHHLEYNYYNHFDSCTYSIQRYLSVPAYEKLRNQSEVKVSYPKYFPEEVIVDEVDKQKPLGVMVFFLLALAYSILNIAKIIFFNSNQRFRKPGLSSSTRV